MRKWRFWSVEAAVLGLAMVAGAQAPAANKEAAATVEAKLDETLDTTFAKPGDKISAVLQAAATVNSTTLPKGTKLTGTVLKAVNQDKAHKNSGLVLVFNTAVVKGGSAVPVHVAMLELRPSHADEIEKIDVGSGQSTDATMHADAVMGAMDDANNSPSAKTTTAVNGVKVTSNIKGVLLFASGNGSASGVVMAIKGPLILDKWTRMEMVVSAPPAK
ncbi:MAG: hypothetical protein V4555_02945 [Acidobacteriota bacterium]